MKVIIWEVIQRCQRWIKGVFETKLKAETMLLESTNESNPEASQAYSNELIAGWLSRLGPGTEEDSRINLWDSEQFEYLEPTNDLIPLLQPGAVSGQQRKTSSNFWLPDMFNQSLLSSPSEITEQPSVSLGEHSPGIMTSVEEVYVSRIELPFEDGDPIVRLCYRREDGRSRFVCRTVRPPQSRKDCSTRLVSLDISRSGPFLEFYRIDQPKKAFELWARLKFSDYESTYIILLPFRLLL